MTTTGLGPAGRLTRFFIDSKLTVLLMLAALGLGALSVALTPQEEEPQIIVPVMDIFVGLPGADPAEVENRVTIPLEKRMWEIPGVEYVYSASMPSVAMVTVRFYVGEDQERSLVKVYDKLVSGMDRMPKGATPPLVKVRTIDDVPVLGLTLWSDRYEHPELRRIAAQLAREIQRLDDVSRIDLIGGQRRQVRVMLDSARMAAFGVDPNMLVQALQWQNATAPAGEFESGDRAVVVETGAFLETVEDVANLVVGVHMGRPVYLRDVADVRDTAEEVTNYVFFSPGPGASEKGIPVLEGKGGIFPAVTIAIAKRKGSDAEAVVERVMEKVHALEGEVVPPDVHVTVTRDYGETSREKAHDLLFHLGIAIVSVTLVIGVTLGWRGGLVVFVALPVTLALTLFTYWLFGYTLNRVTLFALIFVTGIVVDDAIIVVENIVRHFSMKKLPPLQAAVTAVDEVGNPTILATLTVIAAVMPMAFVRGLMGPYMRPMPIGASLAMLFSLGVALVMTPWLAYRLLKGGHGHGHEEEGYDLHRTWIYRFYRWLLVPMIKSPARRWAFLGLILLLQVGAVLLLPAKLVTVKMLPFDNKSELQVIVDMPEGTTLEQTARVAREIGLYLGTVPEVTDVEIYAGTAAPFNFNGLIRHYDLRRGANVADLQVNLLPKKMRDAQSHDIARRIRPPIQEIARKYGAAVKIAEIPPGPPVMATLVAEVYGPNREERIETARKIKRIFEETEGVVDIDWLVEAPQEKVIFEVDREKAALHGVPAGAVAKALRLALHGEDAGLLHDPDEVEPVTIRLRLPRAERSSIEDLRDVRLASMAGGLVPLSELVRVKKTVIPGTRYRKNLLPVVYVIGDVAGREESPVYAILKMADEIAKIETPEGTTVEQFYTTQPWSTETPAMKWDGEWHITYEVFRDLGISFAVVMVLIYMLIIAWFQRFLVPLVMMISIPLSLVGILPAHWLYGAFFTATSMIGFIALAGIMVRNGVLLIDFVDLALERGKTFGEALIEGGAVRFRPIVLTAIAVIVGSFVILFDPIFQGLAISMIAGAVAATVLTLVVVPVLHFMLEKRQHRDNLLPEDWK